jgi:hypothetical protein
VVKLVIHIQKFGNKKTSPFAFATIALFGATNPYKKIDEQ